MKKNRLIKNTLLLYVLTFSSYVFMFVTIPYQTRILGPELFGVIGVTTAVMMFVSLVLDFGFMIHATGEISRKKDSKSEINSIYSSVMYIKLALAALCVLILPVAGILSSFVQEYLLLFYLYLFAYIAQSLLPDFLYRGLEDMMPITIRTVISRSVFVVLIFAFLRSPEQYNLIPLFFIISNTLALALAWIDVHRRYSIKPVYVKVRTIFQTFKASSQFFLSRIATTVYGASSTIIVGATNPGIQVGYYSSADKLVVASKAGFSPIADSIYPYMINTKNYSLLKKVILVTTVLSVSASALVFFNAEYVCRLLFGDEFVGTAPILQALLPILAITPIQYLLGFPALSPIDLQKHANYSIFLSASIYVLLVCGLVLSPYGISPVSIALVVTISELSSVVYRGSIALLAKYKWRLI